MRWSRRFRLRVRSLYRKDEVDAELSEELQFHLEREAAKNEETCAYRKHHRGRLATE